MDFGLFYYCQGRGVPHDQAYAEMLDQIALAETLGFGECWFAEHHFTDYSLLPSPNLMIAAALQRTTRMRLGNYVKDTLLLVCSFGGLSHAQVCRSLELFAESAIRPRQTVR